MSYTIINAGAEHIPALEALEKSCFWLPWTAEQLESQLPDEQHKFIVALSEDGELLGYVGMMYVLDEGYISNVAVAPAQRRQGIGRALLKRLLDMAAELELAFVSLEVRHGNSAAIALYEQQGFVKMGERKNYYDFPKENAIIMTKFMK